MRLEGKVAIVTGGGSGIGGAIAERFAAEGASVLVADIDRDRSTSLVSRITADGDKANYFRVDVTNETTVREMVDEAASQFGKLDILVNNVGGGAGRSLEEIDEALWDWNFTFALKSTFLCCRAALPKLLESGNSAIVNISSINGVTAIGLDAYGAAKAGVIHLTKNIAVRYGPRGLRANVIAPGTTETDFWLTAKSEDPHIMDRIGKVYPPGRVCRPDEIANAALFLASDEASFVNGALLPVDGGFTAGSDVFERAAIGDSDPDLIWSGTDAPGE